MLEKIKILLGLPVEEHLLDEKLNIIPWTRPKPAETIAGWN